MVEIANVDNAGVASVASGHRGEKETGVKFYDSQVGQKIGKGSAVITGETEGTEYQRASAGRKSKPKSTAPGHESADPLIGQRVPCAAAREHHAFREYFDAASRRPVSRIDGPDVYLHGRTRPVSDAEQGRNGRFYGLRMK